MKTTGIDRFFPEGRAFGTLDVGKTKQQVLRAYLEGRKFDEVVAIGDSPHDMIGTINYLYAHPGRKHRKWESHYKINNLLDVLREV